MDGELRPPQLRNPDETSDWASIALDPDDISLLGRALLDYVRDPPVIYCRRVHGREVDLLQFTCPHCDRVHTHGADEHGSPVGSGDGHRVAHCDGGPFASSGYVLREVA